MISKGQFGAAVALLALAAQSERVSAQREIVQPLPAPAEGRLGDALSRLAQDATDVSALLDAGEASLELGDIEAAIGFFGRANDLSPNNARMKLGLAKAYTRSRRPVEALRLFAEAEQAGVTTAQMAEDRGLAFDLVGDAASAQQLYRVALANGSGDEITRRLALSQAISGDREGFEATLLPLLQKRDVSAYRTRAFGLAIMGKAREAKEIANTMLSSGMGARMAAYFEYMPRLTKAQQAAAGNLGIFPRAAAIGTDDRRIANYSGTSAQTAQPAPQPARVAQADMRPATASLTVPAPTPTPTPTPTPRFVPSPAPTPTPGPAPTSTPSGELPPALSPQSATATLSGQRPSLATTVTERELPRATGEAAGLARAGEAGAFPNSQSASPLPSAQEEPDLASVEEAFSSFSLAPESRGPAANGAVDITKIKIPRERDEPKPPPPPAHPSRHWVQVATGKDTDALGFDWRRISRKAEGKLEGKGPFVTPWGEANRLLSGPYDSAAKAREMVKELKELGVDSFTFTSAAGEAIEKL